MKKGEIARFDKFYPLPLCFSNSSAAHANAPASEKGLPKADLKIV